MHVTLIQVQKPAELSSSLTGRHYLLQYVRKCTNNDLNLFFVGFEKRNFQISS